MARRWVHSFAVANGRKRSKWVLTLLSSRTVSNSSENAKRSVAQKVKDALTSSSRGCPVRIGLNHSIVIRNGRKRKLTVELHNGSLVGSCEFSPKDATNREPVVAWVLKSLFKAGSAN